MRFNFGISELINFEQEFLTEYSDKPLLKINRFSIYVQYTRNLFPSNSVDYFLITDRRILDGDSAILGIKWDSREKQIIEDEKLLLLSGDAEILNYIAKAIIPRIKLREKKSFKSI